jgi:hypothetical protein
MGAKDRFCSHCGQKWLNEKDFSVKKFFVESVGDFFHFDSKFVHTIVPLLFKPGLLTKEYLEGKRQRFFHPFKMFLFISVVYFFVAGMLSEKKDSEFEPTVTNKNTGIQEGKSPNTFQITTNNPSLQKLNSMNPDTLREKVKKEGIDKFIKKEFPDASRIRQFTAKQYIKINLSGPELFTEELNHVISKMVFLIIPFFAGLLKLFYIRRKTNYFDHLIFSFHFHSFIFMLFLIREFFSPITEISFLLILPIISVYLYLALKKVYSQSLGKTFIKIFLLHLGYLFVLLVFFIIVIGYSVIVF